MKLEVGMYVRTKEWGIQKITWFDNEEPIMECGFTVFQKSGYKARHNIIDLIEEHDILLLFDKEYGENYKAEVVLDGSNFKAVVNYEQCVLLNLEYELITEEHIKLLSIVTKEQFSNM